VCCIAYSCGALSITYLLFVCAQHATCTRGAQVAMRFPSAAVRADKAAKRSAAAMADGKSWHVDGFGEGTHSPFALLVGVCLSDTEGEGHDPAVLAGNLAVHPGAHWTLQEVVKTATQSHDGGAAALSRVEGGASRLQDLGPPTVLRMRRGDVVIAHQKLPHRGMPNFSPNIRCVSLTHPRHPRCTYDDTLIMTTTFTWPHPTATRSS
jgi:hypothetical protein